jgi:hypothetical protein
MAGLRVSGGKPGRLPPSRRTSRAAVANHRLPRARQALADRGRSFFVNSHPFELRDARHWMEKHGYLAVGTMPLEQVLTRL